MTKRMDTYRIANAFQQAAVSGHYEQCSNIIKNFAHVYREEYQAVLSMVNSVALTGRLTKDVDLRTTQSGISVASFTLAVNRQYSKDKEADFINCVAFKKTAEVLQQFAGKGRLIGVTGSIQTRHYTGKDGKEVYVTEVLANNVSFLDSRNSTQNEYSGQQSGYSCQQGNQLQYGQQAPQGQNFGQQGGNSNQWPQGGVNVSQEDLPW